MLPAFMATYPDVVLDITLDDAVVDMVANGYDAAIRIGEVIERDMVAVPLGPELRMVAVATPAYIAAHGMPQHPRDLVRHRCIRWRWPGHVTPYAWELCENGTWFEVRSEEHTSELQSLMRISYAVFCLKKTKSQTITLNLHHN